MANEITENAHRAAQVNVPGVAVFIGLRAADVFLQYGLIRHGWAAQLLTKLGAQPVATACVTSASSVTGLSPYYVMILLMALGASIKHIALVPISSHLTISVGWALGVALFGTVYNSLNTTLSLWTATSQAPPAGQDLLQRPYALVGAGLYVVGILTAVVSELQRFCFRRDPTNKGIPYDGGLFRLARHIHLGCGIVWCSSYALAAGGWPAALAACHFFFYASSTRTVSAGEEFMLGEYGDEWVAYQTRVPYLLIPWVY